MLSTLLVLALGLFGWSSAQDVYAECGSVKVDYPLLAGRVEGEREQTLQPIRISLQFVNISDELLSTLQSNDSPIQSAVRYFQSFLSVNRFIENLKAPPTCDANVEISQCPTDSLIPAMCGPHVHIPADHTGALVICSTSDMNTCVSRGDDGNGVVDSDYVLYVTSQQDDTCNQSEPIVGYAGPCAYAENKNNQPYMGFINICPMALTQYTEEFVSLFVRHELTHALVFLDKLLNIFPSHPNPRMTSQVGGQSVTMITTPNVVAAAKEHFNCPHINGSIVENEGGPLTQGHWESHLYFPELMNGILYQHLARYTVVSNITLSLFADSEWYSVNHPLMGTQLLWGSGLSCEFIEERCNNAYRCSPCCNSHIQCTDYDARAFGYCTRPRLHDSCSIVMPGLFCSSNSDGEMVGDFITEDISLGSSILVFNQQSICTEAGQPTNQFNVNCARRRCVRIEGIDSVALGFTVGAVEQWCRKNDEFIFNGTILCPTVDIACATTTVDTIDPATDPIPPPLCHESCETCQAPQDPAGCITCGANKKLNGDVPSTCVSIDETCTGNTYPSSGQCIECPVGCSLCDGPQNTDCLACVDTSQFRDTTNKLDSPCTDNCPSDRGVMNSTQFGIRLCVDLEITPTPNSNMTSTATTTFAHTISLVTATTLLLTTIC